MSSDKKFKNESQDARRHDQQHAVHPDEKMHHSHEKLGHKSSSDSKNNKKK